MYACARLHTYIMMAASASPRMHSALVHSAGYACARLHMHIPAAISASPRRHSALVAQCGVCMCTSAHVHTYRHPRSPSPRRHSAVVHSAVYARPRLYMYIPTAISASPRRHSALAHSAGMHVHACTCTYLPPSRLRLVGIVLSWHSAVYACARLHMYIPTAIFALALALALALAWLCLAWAGHAC